MTTEKQRAEEIAVDALISAASDLDYRKPAERIVALRGLARYLHHPRAAEMLRSAAKDLDYRREDERSVALESLAQGGQ